MNDEEKWSDISRDISNVAKKIKSHIDEEDLVEDLKDTFKNTIESTSQLINNIIQTVESTVTDEEIKKDTKEVVNNINLELKSLINETKKKFSGGLSSNSRLRKNRTYIRYNKKKCLYYSLLLINWVGSSIGRARSLLSSRSWVRFPPDPLYFEKLK